MIRWWRKEIGIGVVLLTAAWIPFFLTRFGLLPHLLMYGTYEVDTIALGFTASLTATLILGVMLLITLRVNYLIQRTQLQEQHHHAMLHRDFLRRLDHEMKNPLTTIRIALLNIQDNLTPAQQGSLTRIIQQTQRLQKLVEDLRYLTEIEEHKLEQTSVNLTEVIENAIAMVGGTPEQQSREIDCHIQQVPWQLPDIWGDPELLLIVFRNLIDNAVKYTQPKDRIVIRAVEDHSMALVEVADSGIGIASEALPHVFDDLYRGENARGTVGSGLGLAIVQRIVALHNGRIEIDSRLEQGTILRLWLPLVSKHQNRGHDG